MTRTRSRRWRTPFLFPIRPNDRPALERKGCAWGRLWRRGLFVLLVAIILGLTLMATLHLASPTPRRRSAAFLSPWAHGGGSFVSVSATQLKPGVAELRIRRRAQEHTLRLWRENDGLVIQEVSAPPQKPFWRKLWPFRQKPARGERP